MINRNSGNWAAWPVCPRCQARREAQCSVCSARGTDFSLADFEEPEDAEEGDSDADVLLLCSTCDEPFTPQFVGRCAACGFDFGEGIESEEIVHEEINSRVVLVIIGMAVLLVGLLGFFALVLR
ncbi:MAG: hypothetical protein O3C40_27760 [Planctomycetota bacterium]|nr:hypothetical protein [Planctomycetota bacterium]